MTLKFMDSFETYQNAADIRKTFIGSTSVYEPTFPVGRRAGTKCFNFYHISYSYNLTTPVNFVANETCTIGFAFKMNVLGGSGNVTLYISNDTGWSGGRASFAGSQVKSQAYRNSLLPSSITPYNIGQWHHLEIQLRIGNDPNGQMRSRLDGVEFQNWQGDNEYGGQANNISKIYFLIEDDFSFSIDDLYILDDNGTVNNDWLGDCRVDVVHPNGAGNYTQFTPSAGANYECIDDTYPDESDFVSHITLGEKDSYAYPDVATDIDDAAIYGLGIRNITQRTAGADNIKIDGLIRTGSTDYNAVAPLSLPDSFYSRDFIFEDDPSDLNIWTQAKINACEFGMEVN